MSEFQFADIIILALIAGFIALRLRNTLGKDVGHRPDMTKPRAPAKDDAEDRVIAMPGISLKDPAIKTPKEIEVDHVLESVTDGHTRQNLAEIAAADASFKVSEFVEGAKGAFEWVLDAYNKREVKTLKGLMHANVYKEFEAAIKAAEAAENKTEITLVSLYETNIVDAKLKGHLATITVQFLSEQIHITRNEKDEIIAGDASTMTRVDDEWVFERHLRSRDPNWTVIDT